MLKTVITYLSFKTTVHCLLLILFINSINIFAQLQANSNLTAQQLVQTIVGKGYKVSNIKINSPKFAIGSFTATNTNLGINSGIVLTTGRADTAIGPNNSKSATYNNTWPGDTQLDSMSNVSTYDACSIEFDMEPQCDSIKIHYVFGSEEYPEYVGTKFNDIFAFFLSGPGINGVQNIATVPGTSNYVTINNVSPVSNSQYYTNNQNGGTIEYDGFTKPLYASAKVIPCNIYHLKIVIADVADGIFDSGVFIEAGTVQCSSIMYNDAAQNTNAVEGCKSGTATFCRTGNISQPYVVHYKTSGTAIKGTDYIPLPDSILIPAGQTCASINIQSLPDNIKEQNETVAIAYYYASCPVPDTVKILIKDIPPVNPGNNQLFCSGDTVKTGTIALPGQFYFWLPVTGAVTPNQSFTNITFINNTGSSITNTYTLIVTDSASQCSKQGSVQFTVWPKPTALFSAAGTCANQGMQFADASTAAPGSSIKNWFWDFYNQYFDTIQNPSFIYSQNGTYPVRLIATDTYGCSDDTIVNVLVYESPVANFTYTKACAGDTTLFQNTSSIGIGLMSMNWDFGDGTPGCICHDPKHFYSQNNIYNVTLTVTSDKNCSVSIKKQIEVYPKPSANFYASNLCEGTAVSFQNLSIADSWTWDFGDGTISTLKNPSHLFINQGNKNIQLIVSNKYGCTDSMIRILNVYPLPTADFTASNTTGCAPLCVTFTDASTCSDSTSINSWQWITGQKNWETSNGVTTICFDDPGAKTSGLIVTTKYGCSDTLLKNNLITVYPKPLAEISVSPTEASELNPIINIQSNAQNIDSSYYYLGDGSNNGASYNFNHYYAQAGAYTITQIVKNEFGCRDTTDAMITIRPEEGLFIPNAFTPNENNYNEIFYPKLSGTISNSDFKMQIYNRWGEMVFETNDINKGWNGSYMNTGEISQMDTYVYLIILTNKQDGSEILRRLGHVTLIK